MLYSPSPMTTPMYIMLVSGLILLALFLFLKAENANGRRLVLSSSRNKLDLKFARYVAANNSWRRYIGTSSVRLFLHFVLHHILGIVLFIIKSVETRVHLLRRRNKIIAKGVSKSTPDNHLHHISKHKEENALSAEEKEVLRERSLND